MSLNREIAAEWAKSVAVYVSLDAVPYFLGLLIYGFAGTGAVTILAFSIILSRSFDRADRVVGNIFVKSSGPTS